MTQVAWNDGLKLGLGFQDADHEESVGLMNAMQTCSDAELPALFVQHQTHLREHLARENELMERIGFFAIEVHRGEHERILAEQDTILTKLTAGDLAAVRQYVQEDLPAWFLGHLQSMDAMTALFAQQRGER
ncbi:MAG: hemerythrin [Rhodospirillales bacterium]|nr:hemerythrin [Rhodospirillales bacterium]